jgi:phosphatidylglycerol---prolipoprotein diacylglyceryl transferase
VPPCASPSPTASPEPRTPVDPILHNIDPFLFRIGDGFGVRWYSIPYLLGMLFTYLALRRTARRNELRGVTEENAESFVLLAIALALLGARFFHVFIFEYDRYGFDPLAWIAVWKGGLAFHGGLLGVILAVYLFGKQNGIRMVDLLDRIAVPVALAMAFGRIANFVNAEMYGTPYSGPFCVDYSQNEFMSRPPEGCRHPVQLYESLQNFLVAGGLALAWARFRPRPGVITWSFIALYGSIRFLLMFVREERIYAAGLTLSQIFSGVMAVLGVVMLIVVFRTEPPRNDGAGGSSRAPSASGKVPPRRPAPPRG